MSAVVLDASAVLAFINGEPGSDLVESSLEGGAACSTANWSEIMQKTLAQGRDWPQNALLLQSYDLAIEPVTITDAECAAEMWQPGSGLSLADRLCIALGERLDATVLTADTAWGTSGRIEQIR